MRAARVLNFVENFTTLWSSLAGSAAALVRDVGDAFTSLFPSMRRLAARWYHLHPAGFLNLLDSLATA